MFFLVHHQNFIKTISTKKLNYQHFIHVLTTIPCLRRFPPQILVWGNGPCRSLSHPPPPWPRGAARPRSRGRSGLRSAAVFCLGSCGPRPIHRQSPTERKGRKFRVNHVGSQDDLDKLKIAYILQLQKANMHAIGTPENSKTIPLF